MKWHTTEISQVFDALGSSPQGLTTPLVQEKIAAFGRNVIIEKGVRPAWKVFLQQFTDFMILVLIVAAVISGIAGDRTDMIIILVIIFLNAIVGFLQEYKAEK